MKNLAEFEIIGRVGRITAHDHATRVSICANYRYQGDGAWKDDPHWNEVVVFSRQLREYISEKLAKGALVYARGRIRQNQFKDAATNETRYTTDLVAVDIGAFAQ